MKRYAVEATEWRSTQRWRSLYCVRVLFRYFRAAVLGLCVVDYGLESGGLSAFAAHVEDGAVERKVGFEPS